MNFTITQIIRIVMLLACIHCASAQLLTDIEGDVKLTGRLDINDGDNVLIGMDAGQSILGTAQYNTVVGGGAGSSMTSASYNAFFGLNAGNNNTVGGQNSFFGFHAGFRNGDDNQNAFANSFYGHQAGLNNFSGDQNSFFGKDAGMSNVSGSRNTAIGHNASLSADDAVHESVIGAGAVGNGDSTVTLGALGTKTVHMGSDGTAMVVSSSDRRMKKDIVASDMGLAFINSLRPVSYLWKDRSKYPPSFNVRHKLHEDISQSKRPKQYGLIAQEVKQVLDDMEYEWNGWHINKKTSRQGLTYSAFVVPLIKSVQELDNEITDLKASLTTHQQLIYSLEERLIKLESAYVKNRTRIIDESE